jgi:hypothetical protein
MKREKDSLFSYELQEKKFADGFFLMNGFCVGDLAKWLGWVRYFRSFKNILLCRFGMHG